MPEDPNWLTKALTRMLFNQTLNDIRKRMEEKLKAGTVLVDPLDAFDVARKEAMNEVFPKESK